MDLPGRLTPPVAAHCQADGDEGVHSRAPGGQRTGPYGHTGVAAVVQDEHPLQAAVTRAGLAADPILAGEGGGHG